MIANSSPIPALDSDLQFSDWRAFLKESYDLFPHDQQWVFRGQSSAAWLLQSRLERELQRYKKNISAMQSAEACILREFFRRHRNYSGGEEVRNALEALSFIQHFGGPTRYLDWSYSIYVAAFFALREVPVGGVATLWCFKSSFWDDAGNREKYAGRDFAPALTARGSELLELMGVPIITDKGIIQIRPSLLFPCVFPISPFSMNINIERQQGLFLMASDVSVGFEANLSAMIAKSEAPKTWLRRIDLVCSEAFLRTALIDLRRMAIANEVLFGGPTAFCHSLAMGIADRYHLQGPIFR